MALRFNHLTRLAVRALNVGGKITEHGITAERQTNGDCRYSINIMVDGQRIHRVIGRESDGVTREQAERAIESLRTKAREGRLDLPKGQKTFRPFTEAADEYLRRINGHPKFGLNLKRKKIHIRRLSAQFKNTRLDKLTDLTIAEYQTQRQAEGVANATVNRELATLSHFLNRCLEWGWIRTKPKFSKGIEARKQIVVLGPAEKNALITSALNDHDPLTWLFVTIAISTGMRHSEILRMHWGNVDFGRRRIFVPQAKAGQREQPISAKLAETLSHEWEQLSKPSDFVFATTRADAKRPHRQSMAQAFQRVVKSANLDPKKVTPHVLRHTAITSLVQQGVDLPTIQRISGHKTLAMVLRYTHIADEHVDQAIAKLDADIPDSITPKLHTQSVGQVRATS